MSRRRRRPAARHHRASGRRRAAIPRPAAGTPRGPSTRRRAPGRAASGTVPARYAPTRELSAMRWLRSTAEIESSWTHESRRIVSSTSRAEPVRERVAYPCAEIARRRSCVIEMAFTPTFSPSGRAVGEAAGDAPQGIPGRRPGTLRDRDRTSSCRRAGIRRDPAAGIRSRSRPRRRARAPGRRTAERLRGPRRRCHTT